MGGPKTRITQVSSWLQAAGKPLCAVITCVLLVQESFDAAVQENRDEFGMEACNGAINQPEIFTIHCISSFCAGTRSTAECNG